MNGHDATAGVLKIVAFPFAGGSSYSYARLSHLLPSGVTMTTLDPPGHGRRMGEAALQDVGAIAADLLPGVLREAGVGNYALFGHSMGAYVALAVLDALVAAGARLPARLVLSGAAPPHRRPPANTSTLPRPEFLARVQAMGGMPPQVLEQPELLALFEPILRADFAATERYLDTHRRACEVPVLVLSGTDDTIAGRTAAAWADCFRRQPETVEFAGGHFFLFEQPAEVAATLARGATRIDAAAR